MTSRWELREEACNFADKAYDAGRDNENKAATYAREALAEIAGIIGFQGYTHNPGKTRELVEAVKGNNGWGYVVNYTEALNQIAGIVGMEKRDWTNAGNRAALYDRVIERGSSAYRLLREIAKGVEFAGDYLSSPEGERAFKDHIADNHVSGESALGMDWAEVFQILRAYVAEAGLPDDVLSRAGGIQLVVNAMRNILKDRKERQAKSTARGELLDKISEILFTGISGGRPSTLTDEGHARFLRQVRNVVGDRDELKTALAFAEQENARLKEKNAELEKEVEARLRVSEGWLRQSNKNADERSEARRESAELREENKRLLVKVAQLEADNARVSNESFYRGRREGKQQAVDAIQRLQP